MHERISYPGTKGLPAIFSKTEIDLILKTLYCSNDYWKEKGRKDVVSWMKIRDICLVATIYILALRPKEACCLRFDDFNMRYMVVKIRGENNKCRKDRVIPVPKMLFKYYKAYFQFPRDRFWKGSPYLFPSMENSHISSARLKHIFREKILKPAGLWDMPWKAKAQYRTLYKLRHSRASHILSKQIKATGQPDIFAIANFLGHGDIRSTQVYLHTDESYREYLRDQAEIDKGSDDSEC